MPVVAAVDQSERKGSVIRQARELADVYGVDLHVVHVGERNVTVSPKGEGATVEDKGDEEATRIAREIANEVEDHGEFTAVGLVGDPAEELIDYSTQHDAECIVVSARKRSSLGQVLFGSVSQSLLLNADRPVVAAPYQPD
jgi:nucleotide-binding universal stress UspA family protein